MSKKIIVCAVFAVMSSLMVAGPASAAHCVSPEADSPGFSFFGKEFVQEKGAQEAADGSPGGSTCGPSQSPNGISPSERAPGQNK